MLLADMGADVIKVESPTGDGMRAWPPLTEGYSENFASLNRNKRSVTLNLKDPQDLEKARTLCLEADVVLENFRPGVMSRLGLGYEELSAKHPALIYCSISAYGQTGPRSSEGGFDVTLQAMSGVMSVTGEPDGGPVKCGVPVSDFAAGLYAAFSVATMLRQAANSGKGGHIDVPMMGATLGISALQTSEFFGTGNDPRKLGSAHPRNAPYQAFKCADGHFVLAAGNNDLFRRTCEAFDRPELVDDDRFLTNVDRAANQEALRELLEQSFSRLTSVDALKRLQARGVPCAPINSYSQALDDVQADHYQWVQPIDLPGGGQTRTFVAPMRITGHEFGVYRDPPALGQHTEEVFAQAIAVPRAVDHE